VQVPLVACVLAVLIGVGVSVGATRCVMRPQIEEAEQAAISANNQVVSMQSDVSRLQEELRVAKAQAEDANAGVESKWTSSGRFTTGDETLDQEVKDFCDGIVKEGQSQEDAVMAVYTAIAWSEYVERDDAQNPSGENWRIEYARKYYEHDCSGNCYEFAAFLGYCLRYMGLEDAVSQAVLVQLQSGSWGDHGIVYVTSLDGRSCLCDTSLGVDGYMLDADSYNVQIRDVENSEG
jgi:hypothetical protein